MPNTEIPYDLTERAKLRIAERIRNSRRLLKQIGTLLVRDSRQAFQDQRFGDFEWRPTYPRQKAPTLNVAWTLKDFLNGRKKPNSRRFANRPAGVATGEEPWQVAYKTLDDETIELGTAMEGAEGMQTGKVKGVIPVPPSAKALMTDWLFAGKRRKTYFPEFVTAGQMRRKFGIHWKPKNFTKGGKSKRAKDGMETVTEYPNQKYEPKLRKFLQPTMTEYEIQGYQRPFLGIVEKRSEQIGELIQDYVARSS